MSTAQILMTLKAYTLVHLCTRLFSSFGPHFESRFESNVTYVPQISHISGVVLSGHLCPVISFFVRNEHRLDAETACSHWILDEGRIQSCCHALEVKNIYGDRTTAKSNVQRWMKMFKERETSTEDKSCSRWPVTATTNVNDQRLDEFICANRKITFRKSCMEDS